MPSDLTYRIHSVNPLREDFCNNALITSHASDDPIRVKDLYLALGYSEARIRQILHALCEDGWLLIERHGQDGRMPRLRHTDRTATALRSLIDEGLQLNFPNSA